MPDLTIKPGVLQVASAFPDPPFEVETDGTDSGFDAELMQSICRSLGLTWRLIKYSGDDYTVIFDGLRTAAATTPSSRARRSPPERERVALFSAPYLEFNQGRAGERSERPARQLYGARAGHSPKGARRRAWP